MAVYILKRVGLALITLWILSMIIFWVGQQLPGDPGRTILGNLATPEGVRGDSTTSWVSTGRSSPSTSTG